MGMEGLYNLTKQMQKASKVQFLTYASNFLHDVYFCLARELIYVSFTLRVKLTYISSLARQK